MGEIINNKNINLENLDDLRYTNNATVDDYTGIDEPKLKFLQRLMEDTTRMRNVKSFKETSDLLLFEPVTANARDWLNDLQIRYKLSWSRDSKELVAIFNNLHLKTLLQCHDIIANEMQNLQYTTCEYTNILFNNMTGTIRMVGIRKKVGQPLGFTVLQDNGRLIVARILKGGIIEKQELLHVGDTILAVNGIYITKAEELLNEISKHEDHVTLKVSNSPNKYSSFFNTIPHDVTGIWKQNICYMRTLFKYNAEEDTLLPCKEIGLSFDRGEILQIVDQKDPNWWQARKVVANGQTGLIPSVELEERRKAFFAEKDKHRIKICGAKIAKKKKRIVYQTRNSSNFDKDELLLYEEVTKMPPFKRKTLILIGTEMEQRKTLKNALISQDPDKFGVAIPCTSKLHKSDVSNDHYYYVNRKSMEEDIKNNKYLEHWEYNGNLYGIHFDLIREIILQGKMCIIDCSPISLKMLHNSSEYLPFVIFICQSKIKDPVRSDVQEDNAYVQQFNRDTLEKNLQQTEDAYLLQTYTKYVDLILPNDNVIVNVQKIMDVLEVQATEQQWIPVNWIY